MIEFVIVAPLALLVVMTLVQLGLMYSAKQVLNEAVFVAARTGSMQNAQVKEMKSDLAAAMVPLYQNSTNRDAMTRIAKARLDATVDLTLPFNLDFNVLSPSADAFEDFGLTDKKNQRYIPNDNLEFRDYGKHGSSTGLSIQEANTLKIQVTYAYELKVPLMPLVFRSVMCAIDTGVNAFGRGGSAADPSNCVKYYSRGRVPIVAYATVQMQSRAMPSS